MHRWTPWESARLLKEVEKYGPYRQWTRIAQAFPNRMPKQCRERYLMALQPDMRKGPWTNAEEVGNHGRQLVLSNVDHAWGADMPTLLPTPTCWL